MKSKPQAIELRKQQAELNKEMYKYAKEDRRNREAYLTGLQKINKILTGIALQNANNKGHVKKGLTIAHERQLLKEKEIRRHS